MTPQSDPKSTAQRVAAWTREGRDAIIELLENEHAIVPIEIEAKIAERPGTSHHIQPHILHNSRAQLESKGTIVKTLAATRGGRTLPTYSLATPTVSKRTVSDAAARKRLLNARYLQWANGKPGQGRHTGIVGSSLENILNDSLKASAPFQGYRLNNPMTGKITWLYGQDVQPIGVIDNGCLWHDEDSGFTYQQVIEAKNLREWIYPWSKELYQLLYKAAYIAPYAYANGHKVIPVLVCRKAPKTLFFMAQDVGFHVVETVNQLISFGFVPGNAEEEQYEEVRSGLGLLDILDHSGPFDRITNQFIRTIPARAAEIAERFEEVGSHLLPLFREMRSNPFPRYYKAIREEVMDAGVDVRSW